MAKIELFNATIVGRENLSNELIIYRIKPDFGVPDFQPGQYLALGVCDCDVADDSRCFDGRCRYEPEKKKGRLVKRAYSIASPPANKDHLEFFIGLVPSGAFTNRIARLGEGARIHVVPKIVGTFTLTGVPANHNLVLIATGTGIAPYMSMLRVKSTWETERKITVVHGVRLVTDLAYRGELEELERMKAGFRYVPVVSREEAPQGMATGRVQNVILSGTLGLSPLTDSVFLCGNPAMVEEVQALLESKGFSLHTTENPGNIHVEKYW